MSSRVARKKRPPLDRVQPDRSWSPLLGAAGEAPRATAGGAGPTRPRLQDAMSRSVDVGYRVIDEYIQQGQRAAQRLSEGKLTAEIVTSEVQDLSGRIARYASDFFGAWVELLELATAGSAARQAAPATSEATPPPDKPPTRRPTTDRVRVEVVAARPVEVAVDLRAERVTGTVRAHALRSTDPRKPRLTDVGFRSDDGTSAPVLRIGVPDDHPAGTYEGLLLDEATNRPVGTVRVVLRGRSTPARRTSRQRGK
jgi:hypothetical protein